MVNTHEGRTTAVNPGHGGGTGVPRARRTDARGSCSQRLSPTEAATTGRDRRPRTTAGTGSLPVPAGQSSHAVPAMAVSILGPRRPAVNREAEKTDAGESPARSP